MTSLRQALSDYLRVRRRLGFELKATERYLQQFVGFLEQAGAERITSELAVMWAMLPREAHPHQWRQRLSIVRVFARYVATLDPESEIPSTELLRARRPRVAPYIYSPAEISALIQAAGELTPPLRAANYRMVIGLMATTALRLGEALGLDRQTSTSSTGRCTCAPGRPSSARCRCIRPRPGRCAAMRASATATGRTAIARVLPQHQGRPARQAGVQPLLRAADPPDRAGGSRRARPPAPTRPQAYAGCPHAAGLDRGGRGRRPANARALHVPRPPPARIHLQVLAGGAGADGADRRAPSAAAGGSAMTPIAPALQAFFIERMITQRDSSPPTIAAYRDTFRLLLTFASQRTGKQPCQLDIDDLDAHLISAFLNHLQQDRGNSPRTRNARLAAIHSLYKYAALRHPEHLATIGRGWQSRSNATNDSVSPTSSSTRSRRCSPRPTAQPGSVAATTPCCCWPC
jgi:site-specific recombinase XerD